MAYKTVANLKDSVSGQLQGLNLNSVKNLHGAFERAARQLSQKIDITSTQVRRNVTLYDGVYEYTAPTDIMGSTLYDFQPQGITRQTTDYLYKKQISDFDRTKAYLPNGTEIAFEYVNGTARMKIVSTRPMPKIELDTMEDTTGWTAAGSASGLTKDSTVMWQEPSSLRMTLTGASTGTLTKTISSQDLTDYVGVGVVFLAFRTPSATNLTSFSIKLGSSASAYYEVSSITTGFLGAWTADEWLLVALDLSLATTTGSPDKTKIVYCQVSVAHAVTLTNFYVGGLWISLPCPNTLIYGTAAFFANGTSNISQTITDTSGTIVLADDAFALYELECAICIANQQGGSLASGLIDTLEQKLNGTRSRNGVMVQMGLLDIYRAEHPSQKVPVVMSWYD